VSADEKCKSVFMGPIACSLDCGHDGLHEARNDDGVPVVRWPEHASEGHPHVS
jgi:hypothetical protein